MGSLRGLLDTADADELECAEALCKAFGGRSWMTNFDHFAPDYGYLLSEGVTGLQEQLRASARRHRGKRRAFALAQLRCMESFSAWVSGYGDDAERAGKPEAAAV